MKRIFHSSRVSRADQIGQKPRDCLVCSKEMKHQIRSAPTTTMRAVLFVENSRPQLFLPDTNGNLAKRKTLPRLAIRGKCAGGRPQREQEIPLHGIDA